MATAIADKPKAAPPITKKRETKDLRLDKTGFKILDSALGQIEAYVSVFGIVDSMGEVVDYGAYAKTLKRKLPAICWSHDWSTIIGKTLEAEEVKAGDLRLPESIRQYGGLRVRGQLNLDTQAGREAFSNLQNGYVDEFSVGYEVESDERQDDARHLKEMRLFEWSPVLAGANPATVIVDAKMREAVAADEKDPEAAALLAKAREQAEVSQQLERSAAKAKDAEKADKPKAGFGSEDVPGVDVAAPGDPPADDEQVEADAVDQALQRFEQRLTEYLSSDQVDGARDLTVIRPMLDDLRSDVMLALGTDDPSAELAEPVSVGTGSAKPEGEKIGRVLSQSNYDKIAAAIEALQAVLEAATPVERSAHPTNGTQSGSKAANSGTDAEQVDEKELAQRVEHLTAKVTKGLEQLMPLARRLGMLPDDE